MRKKFPILLLVIVGLFAAPALAQQTTTQPNTPITQASPKGGIIICDNEQVLYSRKSTDAISLTIHNATAREINLFWVNFTGNRVFYNQIAAGQSLTQPTFRTHPWILTDASGQCLEIILPGYSTRAVTVQ